MQGRLQKELVMIDQMMHLVATIPVVVLAVALAVIIGVGAGKEEKRDVTICFLVLVALVAVVSGLIPTEYTGMMVIPAHRRVRIRLTEVGRTAWKIMRDAKGLVASYRWLIRADLRYRIGLALLEIGSRAQLAQDWEIWMSQVVGELWEDGVEAHREFQDEKKNLYWGARFIRYALTEDICEEHEELVDPGCGYCSECLRRIYRPSVASEWIEVG
jgi:hypothetical protein